MVEERPPLKVDLRLHSKREGTPGRDDKGRGFGWRLVNTAVFLNPVLPAYRLKSRILRAFGATIGEGVVIKSGVNIKYPWHLTIGDHTWIGEQVWLDSTSPLRIGKHTVISQGVYLCCGTHDWRDPGMGSVAAPIVIEDGTWIAAFSFVAGGVTVGQEAMLAMGSVVFADCEPRGIYRGNPAQRAGERRIRDYAGPHAGGDQGRPPTSALNFGELP